MPIYHVEIVGTGFDWTGAAAWVQAIFSVVAIIYSGRIGIKLQDRDRIQRNNDEFENQKVALIAIGKHCVQTIGYFVKRENSGTFRGDELGWLKDEADANEAAVSSVDLMKLRSTHLTQQVASLQEAARTCRRRLGYNENWIRNGNQPKAGLFRPLLDKANSALAAIEKLQQPSTHVKHGWFAFATGKK